jgi:hypothetical protein
MMNTMLTWVIQKRNAQTMTKTFEIKPREIADGYAKDKMTVYVRELHDGQLFTKHGPFVSRDQADRYKAWLERDAAKELKSVTIKGVGHTESIWRVK